jgi:LuxR family transcriptional regulator, maltose regulon positive regulatory protein
MWGLIENQRYFYIMFEPPLLVTKFSAPPVRETLIQREPLIERLNQSRSLPLVLLSSSAGFGKTTLLSAWASQCTQNVSWLSLDEQDNDPVRFWISVIATLRHSGARRGHMTGEAAFTQLHDTPPPQLLAVLTSLINELTAEASETTLILDDYHVIEEPAIHASLVFVLEHAPSCFHLILSSRVDPPLTLSRWRARGQLVEIRDADLRLSEAETLSFLSQVMGLQLGEKDALRLAHRTEGWIVGVQLAALALRGHQNPSAWILAFSGSQRFIMDYVRDEILKPQPARIQQFLLQTAVLTEMNAALCQMLTGEQASQELLEFLEQANLFVVPLDEERRWYRFHPLFREALLTRLRVTEPELIPRLYQRAAAWYAAQERWSSAIPYAFEAEDQVLATDLLEHFIAPQSWHDEYHTLRRWLARLPREVLRSRPDLSFMYVSAMVLTSRRGPHTLDLVDEPLQWAEQSYREAANQAGLGAVLALRAVLTTNQGDFAHAFALARDALNLLPEHDQQWRRVCLIIRGAEAALSDQGALARSLLLQGLALSETGRWLPSMQIATAMLGDVSFASGELHQAAHYFRQTLATSDEREELIRFQLTLETGARENYYERPALYGLAALAYEWNKLEEAEHYLQEALSQGQFVFLHILTPGLLLQVRLLLARGEFDQARKNLVEISAQAHRPEVLREIQQCQAWLALKMGDSVQTKRWVASCRHEAEPLAFVRREEEALLLARLHIAEGQPQAALGVLESWKRKASESGRLHSERQILILEALAHEAGGARDLARATLLEVVTRIRLEGYQRLFLDEGEVMETLLKTLLPDLREKALISYVRTLLHAFAPASAQADAFPGNAASLLLDPLTPQERRVLHLLAEGASNQDIAKTLVISLATARKHVSNILSKLDAVNRTQAIARAREYALL